MDSGNSGDWEDSIEKIRGIQQIWVILTIAQGNPAEEMLISIRKKVGMEDLWGFGRGMRGIQKDSEDSRDSGYSGYSGDLRDSEVRGIRGIRAILTIYVRRYRFL